jgi:hypothetical protein
LTKRDLEKEEEKQQRKFIFGGAKNELEKEGGLR